MPRSATLASHTASALSVLARPGTFLADPRAHGNTARPLKQLPAIKLINGLTRRAIDEPTSAGNPPCSPA